MIYLKRFVRLHFGHLISTSPVPLILARSLLHSHRNSVIHSPPI
ncbi:hypothetical protein VSK70_26480 [Bacillus sp. WOD8 KX774193]|nr:hypothetical protein [Bacillus sp. WOD8 KX774193]